MARGAFRFRGRRALKGGNGESTVLTPRQQDLIAEEHVLLGRLGAALEVYPGTPEDREALRRADEQLNALFMLVIVGEFNAGKSAFINALVGAPVMPEGVLPTTSVINLLRHGDEPGETMLAGGVIERRFPVDFLSEITVVDTPGTNAIIREHEALTQQFVPRSDLVLFVTSAERPFTESEREFMAEIQEWGKKIVVIINKVDLLRNAEAVKEVTEFVQENIERLLGFSPEVFSVAALLAQQAKALDDRDPAARDRLWEQSRFEALEEYVFETLDEEGRVRLKLLNPLGIAEHLADRYLKDARDRLSVLREDLLTIENIESQLEIYQDDMRRQFAYHLTRIENIIARMVNRGDAFFEETIRIGRIFDLVNSDRIRGEFERQVVGDTEQRIDTTINELIDWMVEQDLRTWEAVTDYIDRRRLSKYEDDLIGEVSGQFRYDRRALLESVSKRAKEEVERYDARREAQELSVSVRNAVATVAVAEAGAVGLGALVVAAASTVAVDITGLLAASVIAGIGLFVLPRRRRTAREEFHRRASELETRLLDVMREQFEHELARSVTRIREAIAPYTRFVRTQQEQLTRVNEELTTIRTDLRAFRHRIGAENENRSIEAPAREQQDTADSDSRPLAQSHAETSGANPQTRRTGTA
ncbi:MAG TPA: dynamin family protein [Thermomicrobiales bacterium]|nr:dynamin family protein [Thermomicrobiales bacterium]